jgi:hypothetical protein
MGATPLRQWGSATTANIMNRAIPLIAILLFGCGAPANPPSLLPRAIESRQEISSIVAPMPTTRPTDPALLIKLKALVAESKGGDADFTKAELSGTGAIAAGRGAAPSSEAWIAAELVKSALQVARQRSAGALAEIDSMAVTMSELTASDPTIGGMADIQLAQSEVEMIIARQTARLDAITR